jgi:hypothetical protein
VFVEQQDSGNHCHSLIYDFKQHERDSNPYSNNQDANDFKDRVVFRHA